MLTRSEVARRDWLDGKISRDELEDREAEDRLIAMVAECRASVAELQRVAKEATEALKTLERTSAVLTEALAEAHRVVQAADRVLAEW